MDAARVIARSATGKVEEDFDAGRPRPGGHKGKQGQGTPEPAHRRGSGPVTHG